MNRVILTTVGTSLLGNIARKNAERARAGLPAWAIADLLHADPREACAEVNVLDRLLEPGDTVELFHSQTADGEQCARAIHAYLEQRGVPVLLQVVEGLTYQASDFHRGLRSLVRGLTQRLRAARRGDREPVLNGLGGFKSEVAYATLVGTLFGIPNYYIHQGYDELMTIPPLPVGWDVAQIDPYFEVLAYLDAEPRTESEAHSRLGSLPQTLRDTLTETDPDGCVYLSPLGDAFFEAYRSRVETATGALYLSARAARAYHGFAPSERVRFDSVLERLRVPEIRRGGSKTLERDHGDTLVFPQGHVNERVFWYEAEGVVYVLEFAVHDRVYKQLYERGVRRSEYPLESCQTWLPLRG